MNPPYGRKITEWVKKASEESMKENTIIVALIPARTDTKWFWDYVLPYASIRFVKGRLYFSGSKRNAPFASILAIYGKGVRKMNNNVRVAMSDSELMDDKVLIRTLRSGGYINGTGRYMETLNRAADRLEELTKERTKEN